MTPAGSANQQSITLAEAVQQALAVLQNSGSSHSETPHLDVELLLAAATGRSRAAIKAFAEQSVPAAELQQFHEWISRRAAGEPVAYLLGERGFWTLDLEVSGAVLIPRPETELLVELTLQLAADSPDTEAADKETTVKHATASEAVTGDAAPDSGAARWRVADLGTGSGAIALALASERPHWQVWATDISEAALDVARRNARRLGLDVEFAQGAWGAALPPDSRWHMIVSNPPYISDNDPHLVQGDVRFEPRSALVAADNGFEDLQDIASQATQLLLPDGWLLLEHGYSQGSELRERLRALGYQSVRTARDLAGHDRVTMARWPGKENSYA